MMKKATKKLLITSLLTAMICLCGAAFAPVSVRADELTSIQSSYSFVDNVSKTTYDGVHYSAFDALSVNFPSTSTSGIVSVGFPFESTDMTDSNAAIRVKVQTVVPVTGRESLRFDLVGSSTMNMKTGATVYKEQNGEITTATVAGSGTGASFYAIDTAEVNGTKLFDGYFTFPVSTWSASVAGVTALNIRTNPLYTKTIWNFGNVEYGMVDANGVFTAIKTLWTPFKADGTANTYTADSSADAVLIKANRLEGAAKSFYLKTKLNDSAANNTAYDLSNYDGIKVHVDNTGNAARSMQLFVWDSATTNLGATSYSWQTKNGLAYFMPDSDCTSFKNSSAYRSSFIPAGFKGEMYIPFTVNADAESGAWQPTNANAGTTFPTSICNQVFVYTTVTTVSFGIGTPELVSDGDAWMAKAFETTSSVNLGAIDDSKALMIEQKADVVSMQYELQPANKGNVAFSTVNNANEVITGGSALAMSIENLNSEPFKLQLTTYNQGNDRVVLGGDVESAKVTFTLSDGTVQLLDCINGYVLIPAYAKGTLTVSYVGGTPSALSNCTYALGYPTGNIFRLYFHTQRTSGAKLPVAYLVGDIAIVNGNGSHTVLTVNGTSVVNLAATDTNYRIERTNILYSGTLKNPAINYAIDANKGSISSNQETARYGSKIAYTVTAKAGYELKAIKVNGEAVEHENGQFSVTVTADTTISAEFEAIVYTVEYQLNGGVNAEGNIANYTVESEDFTLLAATREGYNFDGWYVGEEKVEVISASTLANVTLEAKWSKKSFALTYEVDATKGSIAPASESALYEEVVTYTVTASAGYELKAIKVNGEAVEHENGQFSVTVTADTTISAEFEEVSDDSSVDSSSSSTSTSNDVVTLSCNSAIGTGSTLLMSGMIAIALFIIKKKEEK